MRTDSAWLARAVDHNSALFMPPDVEARISGVVQPAVLIRDRLGQLTRVYLVEN
jgi:hypothetical protein